MEKKKPDFETFEKKVKVQEEENAEKEKILEALEKKKEVLDKKEELNTKIKQTKRQMPTMTNKIINYVDNAGKNFAENLRNQEKERRNNPTKEATGESFENWMMNI